MSDSLAAFEVALTERAAEVEAMLDAALPLPSGSERRVVEAMRHAALGGGKRLRGFLVIEAARLFGLDGGGPLRAAAALECLHAYSLAHDDLPAMDDDDMRRGRPTTHVVFDEATAILAGDALQTRAFELLLAPETSPSAEIRCETAALLAQAAGAGGMVGGQMIDILAETSQRPLSADETRRMQGMKTGALLSASAEIGAVLGGAAPDQRAQIKAYGDALGAVFQIADDLLDQTGDEAEAGKRLRKDAEAGKATLPDLLGVEAARAEAKAHVAAAEANLSSFGPPATLLRSAAHFALARRR